MGNKHKARTKLVEIIERIEQKIRSQEFLKSARKRPQDFTRNRKMPFAILVFFMLNMIKASIQTCLDKFFENIGQEGVHMSEQSFSEARQKIRWEAFRELFETTVGAIYEGFYRTWHGYRVSAIDGSKTQLPGDKALRGFFGAVGRSIAAATAQASALYDVFNNVLIDVQLTPLKTGERQLALLHIDALCKLPSFLKELILFDRGYASFGLIETLISRGVSFVMRVKRGFNIHIDQLKLGDHCVLLQKKGHEGICVRVMKFVLPSGEVETLVTDITDKRMGASGFKKLYFMRWPIETKYDEIKNKLEVENFSGRTVDAVMQDFFITMLMSNTVAAACWEAQADVDGERELKGNKYSYHVNVNLAIGAFKDRFVLAMLEPNPRKRTKKVRRILYLLTQHVVPTRPGRSLPRNPSPRKAKFRHNRKSNC
jgi:hypothetical protein